MDFRDQLKLNVKAGAPMIQIVSHETLRVRAACSWVADQVGYDFYRWNRTRGLTLCSGDSRPEEGVEQAHEIFEWLSEKAQSREKVLLLLEDFHPDLVDGHLETISRLRNFAISAAMRDISHCCIVMSQPVQVLPPELEKDVQVMQMPLPGLKDLKMLMRQACQTFELPEREYHESPRLLEAALGLSTSEAQLAFARAIAEKGRLTESEIPLIVAQKEQVIRKSGNLEYFQPSSSMEDIGGLDRLKEWLERRKAAFTEEARDYGLEAPRGVLLLGLPGTGKSLAAKAVASAWQLPLLRLDMGRVYGGIVGQSEDNMRRALSIAETLSPCVLWIDEIEKGLSGMQSSGSTDGGTTARVLGSFLTWLQEKDKPVFVVATANHIAQLPPELLRKGRVDEIFFVDLPVEVDRLEILKIHLRARGGRDQAFSEAELLELAKQSKGFTGAELEEVVKEGLFRSFSDGRALAKSDLSDAIAATSPLSQTMHELIRDTREWVKGRAVTASSAPPETLEGLRSERKGIRLPQEGENPFLETQG